MESAFRLVKDVVADTAKISERHRLPVVDITKSTPLKGSLAYNVLDDKIYYANGVEWLIGEGSDVSDSEFVLTTPDASLPNSRVLTGTPDQVIVTNGVGTTTLSTPQDIATDSDVEFSSVQLASTGGVATPLDHYEEFTLVTQIAGAWTSRPITILVTKTGNTCEMSWSEVAPDLVSTTDNAIGAIAPLPSRFIPVFPGPVLGHFIKPVFLFNSPDYVVGLLLITDTGNISFTQPGVTWTSGVDSIGLPNSSVSWITA